MAVIEDFRRAQLVEGGRSRTIKKLSMDMGYRSELEFFFDAGKDTVNAQKFFDSQAASSLATLRAAEALRTGEAQGIVWPDEDILPD